MKKINILTKNLKESVGLAPMALGCFALCMFMLYMWQLSISTSAGYNMRAVETEIAALKLEVSSQNARIAKLQSIDSVTGRMQLLGLVKATNVAYVFTNSGSVAVNR